MDPLNKKNLKLKRLFFLDYLRALAIIFVVISHFFGSFWYFHQSMMEQILLKPIKVVSFFSPLKWFFQQNINFGLIGVGLFFLISGFLVQKTVRKTKSIEFLWKKLKRIYPKYLLSLLFVLSILFLNSKISGFVFSPSLGQLLVNSFLLQDILQQTPFDTGVWFLLVLIKFYLLSLILQAGHVWHSPIKILFTIIMVAGLSLIPISHRIFIDNIPYLIFIFVGVAIYNYDRGYWHKFITMTMCLILILVSFLLLAILPELPGKATIVSFSLAFLIFFIGYLQRNRFQYNQFVQIISETSYAWYLIHRVFGYSLIYYLLSLGMLPWFAIIFTILTTYTIAWQINHSINSR